MIMTFIRLGLMLIFVAFISTALAVDTLKHDPFARPQISATLPLNTEHDGAIAEEEMPWSPTLTAVMVAGKNSLITLDGVTLKIGEVKDGFRLVQVNDGEAVFVKGKKRIVIAIKAGAIMGKQVEQESAKNSLSNQNKEQDNPQ
jgi:hypothetical protein